MAWRVSVSLQCAAGSCVSRSRLMKRRTAGALAHRRRLALRYDQWSDPKPYGVTQDSWRVWVAWPLAIVSVVPATGCLNVFGMALDYFILRFATGHLAPKQFC